MSEIKDKIIKEENNKKLEPNYWRSFEDFYNDPKLKEEKRHEFKEGVADDFNPSKLSGISRRKFLALVGASAALAGAGCSDYRDKGEIIPYNNRPEGVTPGKANYYASTSTACPCSCGILIKVREGRPIKVDGNPDHPVTKGKICTKAQASILNLYDPDRIQSPLKKNGNNSFDKKDWIDLDSEIINELSKSGSKEIAIIAHKIISPSALKVFQDFQQRFPSARIYTYELFNDEVKNRAWRKRTGKSSYPLIKWNEAKIILSLEGDFLGTEGNTVENARLFSEGKDVNNLDKFNRLYVVEGNMSLTGMNADYRLRLRPDAQYEFVTVLMNAVNLGSNNSVEDFAKKYSLSFKTLNYLVEDLKSNRGTAFVYAGRNLPEQVHNAVNNLNEALGSTNLYRTDSSEAALYPLTPKEEWDNLINKMNSDQVSAIIHFDSNPAYHLPKDYGYEDAIKKVPNVISLTELENESSVYADYVLPIHHDFESWNDIKTRTGFYSLQQPVISPIFNTRQKEGILLNWIAGRPETYSENIYHEFLMKHWESEIYPIANAGLDFKQYWFEVLHDGIAISKDVVPSMEITEAVSIGNESLTEVSGYAVALKESYAVGDGRFANNGWLQELPHPVSKITWDNYAAISASTAKELNLKSNDMIEITIGSRKLEIPVFIQPGSADKTITIELGYGRSKGGTVSAEVGFNANLLMTKNYGLSPWLFTGASVKKISGIYNLVSAQEHHAFDDELIKDAAQKRGIIREGTVEGYRKNSNFLHEGKEHNLETFYPDWKYTGIKWGMSIDHNKCIGCGGCVVACSAENNIPVVGKDQVKNGREMHWIRVDRYYSGTPDEPEVSSQVMLCQHCDHAPCENVCPVVATTHSPDGLNQMVYNRCVGTRYCSNNCPYKVRRFNFFDFRDHFKDGYQQKTIFNLLYNPEVTVRSRGVMEKCTFCVQRIMEAREDAIRANRELKGSDVTTACQEACPTYAINFGDINDRDSEFAKIRNHELGYYVLEELNVRPNVTYIAKLKNSYTKET